MEDFVVDYAAEPTFGAQLPGGPFKMKVHNRGDCHGEFCVIHKPSEHPLNTAPLNWRADKGIMERICEHGVGHDDPDDAAFRVRLAESRGESTKYIGVHGCDGCCIMR